MPDYPIEWNGPLHPVMASGVMNSLKFHPTPKGDESKAYECLTCGEVAPDKVYDGKCVNRKGRLVHLVAVRDVLKVCGEVRVKP